MSDARLARAIFVTTLAVYLLTSGREPPWGDANVQYMGAEAMVHGKVSIPRAWPDDFKPDADGKLYSIYPFLTSAVQVPGLVVLAAFTKLSPATRAMTKPLTSHLACSLFGALTCLLFFQLCRQRGLSRRSASIATAIVAFATTTWVYAHYAYSEIAQTAAFTGFLLSVCRADDDPSKRNARWLGFWAGMLFALKLVYLAGIGGGVALLLYRKRALKRDLVPLALHALAAAAPFILATAAYNWACWGSPLSSGYAVYFSQVPGGDRYWGENPATGLWGMFLSPGKSIFLYSPPLILGLVAIPRLVRQHRAYLLLLAACAAPVLLVYSRYQLNGDYAWGYRFGVFVAPALAFSVAVLLDAWEPTRVRRAAVAVFLAAGVCVQLLGNAFYWDHFIRISMDARQQWLGQPNRSGAIIPTRGDGHCDDCFEDVHQLEWLPPFQPIVGHWWLLRTLIAGDDAKQAEAAAPWHRYTTATFDIKSSYDRVRLDWWGMLWIEDVPAARRLGAILLLVFLAGAALGGLAWVRATRAPPPGAASPPPPPPDPAPEESPRS